MKGNWHHHGVSMVADRAISMTKVKNLLKKMAGYSAVNISNIRVNGLLIGCSGFIHKDGSDRIVYFNTEYATSPGRNYGRILYRHAEGDNDHIGGVNRYCTFGDFGDALDRMFRDERVW